MIQRFFLNSQSLRKLAVKKCMRLVYFYLLRVIVSQLGCTSTCTNESTAGADASVDRQHRVKS